MNLKGWVSLASLGNRVGVDLWAYKTADGRGIRKAIEYLAPFGLDGQTWPHKQIIPLSVKDFHRILRLAAASYRDEKFRAMVAKLPKLAPAARDNLLFPPTRN